MKTFFVFVLFLGLLFPMIGIGQPPFEDEGDALSGPVTGEVCTFTTTKFVYRDMNAVVLVLQVLREKDRDKAQAALVRLAKRGLIMPVEAGERCVVVDNIMDSLYFVSIYGKPGVWLAFPQWIKRQSI